MTQSIFSKKETKSQSNTMRKHPQMSKTKRKAAFKDYKCILSESLQSYSNSSSPSTDEGDVISVPSNFKRYTIEDRTIKL